MAGVDEVGTILIRGPNVFWGYLDTRHNSDIWVDIGGETWLNTGDLGRQDERGYFWLSGRRKELIIRGGHNIDPKMIEDALLKHPAVAMAAAIGSPDAYAGEVPVAYVQLKSGAAVTGLELVEFAAAHIPERAAVPEAGEHHAVAACHGSGQDFQAGSAAARDRGRCARRGAEGRRDHNRCHA